MYRTRSVVIATLVSGLVSGAASAQSFEADVAPLLETSCLRCHDARTQTPLDFERLTFDLGDHETFRAWERVFERVERGEMPPRGAPRPEPAVVETALGSLKHALVDANLAARGGQRTPLRRLTRLEYQYTIQDLLLLDEAQAAALGNMLPAEADSGGFDTVAAQAGPVVPACAELSRGGRQSARRGHRVRAAATHRPLRNRLREVPVALFHE